MAKAAKPLFASVAPVFWVADVVQSRAHYVGQLGFEIQFEWTDEGDVSPRYLILRKGNTELHLSQSDEARPSIAYFFVDGVQEYYDAIAETDALISEPIRDLPWDMREFEVKDLDNNRLIFGEHLSRLRSGSDA